MNTFWAGLTQTHKTLLIVGGILIGLCSVCGVLTLLIGRTAPTAANLASTANAPLTRVAETLAPGQAQFAATFAAVGTQMSAGMTQAANVTPLPSDMPSTVGAPAVASGGATRENPLPGSQGGNIGGDIRLTVLGLTRPANGVVKAGNMFNPPAPAGMEYAIVQLRFDCGKPANDKCSFFPAEIKSVTSDGQVHTIPFAAGVPGQLSDITYEFFGGGKVSGALVFLFPVSDSHVLLFHEPLFGGTPVYFTLP